MKERQKQASKKPAIAFRQALFWDVDPKTIDPEKNAVYVIERILDFGDDEEVRWMFSRYSKKRIAETMDRPRSQVLNKSRALWSLLLPQNKKKSLTKLQKMWPRFAWTDERSFL